MKIEKFLCDVDGCKKERIGHFQVFHHSQMDASGNGSERWFAGFDLCGAHAVIYADALAEINNKNAHKVVAELGIVYVLQ